MGGPSAQPAPSLHPGRLGGVCQGAGFSISLWQEAPAAAGTKDRRRGAPDNTGALVNVPCVGQESGLGGSKAVTT